MMSLRTYARSAPRLLNQIGTKSIRPQGFLRSSPVLSNTWKQAATPKAIASFHTSSSRKDSVTTELVGVLNRELEFEDANVSSNEAENYSSNTKEFLEQSEYKLVDPVGQDEVTLVRKYNDETITIKFNIADLIDESENSAYDEQALYDDEDADASDILDGQSGGASSKGAINQGRTANGNFKVAPEDSIAPADQTELEEEEFQADEEERAFPARLNIKVERPGKGAIAIDALTQDGSIDIEHVYYFSDAELADPVTPEKEVQRRTLYTGPKYGSLDPDVQSQFDKYLEDRGINSRMALFIPDYIDYKENREYIGWLKNMKKFFNDE